MLLINAATTTETRLDHGGQLRELDKAISSARQTLELKGPAHPLHSESLNNLADLLSTRFQEGGQRSDLDEAISVYRQVLELRPSPDPLRPNSLNNLSKVLLTRFQVECQPSDVNEAILLPKQALLIQSPIDPFRSSSLHNLAFALYIQFQITSQQDSLDESISIHQQALELRPLPHPLRSDSLDTLGMALWTQFTHGGDRTDLDRAISLHRQALELRPSPHSLRSASLNNLANDLQTRFEQEGHQRDLDEAILLFGQALELRPHPHPLQSMSLSNLAGTLWTRFQQKGRRRDLDDSILLERQTLELLIPTHPIKSGTLNNLANVLITRFTQEGHRRDLDEAISLYRQALELRPSPHPLRSMSLNNLAAALWTQFEQEGRQIDLDEAISLNREGLSLRILSHPLRSESLNNLAIALQTQFEKDGQQSVLNEVILLHREALSLRTLSHPFRSESLNSLANALRTQFEKYGQKPELNEALLSYRQALDLRPSPHPCQSQSLYDLGIGLVHAHSLSDNDSDYLEDAMKSFSAATQCLNQPASLRLRIAHTWIKHAVFYGHMSAIDAYDAGLQALPKLATLSCVVKSRQEALLADSDGLARDASRFAIRAGKVNKAIEFLEAGRAVFWSQFLSLRSPLEQLRETSPDLADKLRDTATALELGSHRNILADTSENRQKLFIDQETARLNRLNEEWLKAIDDVRQLNGFEDFLRPRSLSILQVAASEGPVVILIGNDDGSDILVLTSVNVHTIRLSGFATWELQNLVHLTQAASSDSKTWVSHFKDRSGNASGLPPAIIETLRSWIKLEEERGVRRALQKESNTVFRFVLETLWTKVVKPIVDILDLKKSAEPPVVQWCPTGLFSFLPVHAAGCYDDSLAGECAADYFISSYTPTIGALLTHDQTPSTESFKMMVVIQSQELPSTHKELEKIKQYVSDDFLVKLGIPGACASVEAVASRLSDVAIVHFACHGTQDRSNPLDSGLKLEDGLLRVSRIMKEKIPNGALAFLCACETAMGDDKLPDEAMSLGASLLFSGFRRVVATMWAMRDEDGPVIADAFYEELFRGPDKKPTREPDASKSAHALHLAVKKLRAEKVSFRRWVPFIHMGK